MSRKITYEQFKNLRELRLAAEYGIDVHQLIDNLNLSVKQRVLRHQAALELFEKIHNKAAE